jgi:hypothetical protein
MDEASDDGSAKLLEDGSTEIEFTYQDGDEAVLKPTGVLLQQPCYARRNVAAPALGFRR